MAAPGGQRDGEDPEEVDLVGAVEEIGTAAMFGRRW
jgi:hypothetical protein